MSRTRLGIVTNQQCSQYSETLYNLIFEEAIQIVSNHTILLSIETPFQHSMNIQNEAKVLGVNRFTDGIKEIEDYSPVEKNHHHLISSASEGFPLIRLRRKSEAGSQGETGSAL